MFLQMIFPEIYYLTMQPEIESNIISVARNKIIEK